MNSQNEVKKLYNNIIEYGANIIFFTSSTKNEGVSSISKAITEMSTSLGKKSLLMTYNDSYFNNSNKENTDSNYPIFCNENISYLNLNSIGLELKNYQYETNDFLKELSSQYDLLIIDGLPQDSKNKHAFFSDLLCEQSIATILVVKAGSTQGSKLQHCVNKIVRLGANLVGCVINDESNPQLVDELCRETYRLEILFPNLMKKTRTWLRKNQLLNLDL